MKTLSDFLVSTVRAFLMDFVIKKKRKFNVNSYEHFLNDNNQPLFT